MQKVVDINRQADEINQITVEPPQSSLRARRGLGLGNLLSVGASSVNLAERPNGTLVNPGRSFLFLQGMATRFFERLGQTLIERGCAVYRVNFNGGDRAFWRLPGAVDFRGRPEEWPGFLDRLIVDRAISEISLFGDCRPLHRASMRVAETRALRIHVVEGGYLRPGGITFD